MASRRTRNTGSVSSQPRKDGRYEARLTLPDGARKSFYGATRKEAEAKLQKARADLDRGIVPTDGRLTVDGLWQEYLSSNPANLRPTSLRPRASKWKLHISPVIGRVKLAELSPLHIQRVVTTARGKDLNTHTVFTIYSVLKAVLAQGVRWGLLSSNPATAVKVAKGAPRELPLTDQAQVSAFLNAVPTSPYRCAITLAAGLGLRSGEVRALQWKDVDLDAGIVRVVQTVDVAAGSITFGPLKTDASRRELPLPGFVADELRAQRARIAEQRLRSTQWFDYDLVVPGRFGRPVTPNTLISAVKDVCEVAGVPPLVFHHLRHLCATILLMAGVPVKVAQRILGHASPQITLGVYAHIQDGMMEAGAQSMDDAFARLRTATESS